MCKAVGIGNTEEKRGLGGGEGDAYWGMQETVKRVFFLPYKWSYEALKFI